MYNAYTNIFLINGLLPLKSRETILLIGIYSWMINTFRGKVFSHHDDSLLYLLEGIL